MIVELAAPAARFAGVDAMGVFTTQSSFLDTPPVELDVQRQYEAAPMLAVTVGRR